MCHLGLFNHIKLLWELIEQNLVPEPTDPQVLKRFAAKFATVQDFEAHVVNPNANVFGANADIDTLNAGSSGNVKLGRGMLQLEDSDICYINGYLGKLRIECWGPNLEESSDSLWNSACWTSAINLFCQMAASGVYHDSSLNHSYVNNIMMLIQAYNHYVHFCIEEWYKIEMKQKGKYEKAMLANKNQKNSERVSSREGMTHMAGS
ncbi:hypothetical protein O181_046504 [Austropuccinia psidii MF-1]|uniref:Uncharacterized protein n=1 Tax=Austropuccinia psidii MF-1 TaxID=1389203 RepID=A0A9Q3DP79_9BASI|nr:hypothetical protein [Austropuccinia psidii MF-1]